MKKSAHFFFFFSFQERRKRKNAWPEGGQGKMKYGPLEEVWLGHKVRVER